MHFRYGPAATASGFKRWGVYSHHVVERLHPLVNDVNTLFDVPHSRFNDVSREQFEAAGLRVLVESPQAGVHLAVSSDLFRVVLFQGHPEYDTISLLKEYKREVMRFARGGARGLPAVRRELLQPPGAGHPHGAPGTGARGAGAGHGDAGAARAPVGRHCTTPGTTRPRRS